MDPNTVYLFTRNGLGEAPRELQRLLAVTFANLLVQQATPPGKLLFYGEGVKLACSGSPILDSLRKLSDKGTEMILCRTCLDYFGLLDSVEVGEVKGMPDILAAMGEAAKVVSA